MKKMFSLLLVTVMILGSCSFAYAKSPADKLVRGVGNVLSCWLEIPQTMGEEWAESNNAFIGCVAGFFKGLAFTGARLFSGAWDIISFPAAAPRNYEPLFKPDYVFDMTPGPLSGPDINNPSQSGTK